MEHPPPFFRRARKYLNLNHFLRNDKIDIEKYKVLRDTDLMHPPFTIPTLKKDPKIAN